MGRAMLSKSLIQFSLDGWGSVLSLLCDLRPNYGGDNEDTGDSFRRSHGGTAALSSHRHPRLRRRLLGTPGQAWVSLLWGHCSFLLGPGAHRVLFVPSKSLCPQSCVSSGGSMVGLLATSSQRAYATPRSAAPRAPAPAAGHC